MGCTSSKSDTVAQSYKAPEDKKSLEVVVHNEPEFPPMSAENTTTIEQNNNNAATSSTTPTSTITSTSTSTSSVVKEQKSQSSVPVGTAPTTASTASTTSTVNRSSPPPVQTPVANTSSQSVPQPSIANPVVGVPPAIVPAVPAVPAPKPEPIAQPEPIAPANIHVSNSAESLASLNHEVSPPAMKKGMILKCGHIIHSWKSRYFVLSEGIMTYYEGPSPNPPYGVNKKGAMNLRNTELHGDKTKLIIKRVKPQGGDSGRASRFSRSNSSRQTMSQKDESEGHDELVLDIKYPNERDEWMEAIQSHIEYYSEDLENKAT